MKEEIKVPAMGESISEATVGSILKASGSQVKMDEEILELETDKVNQVIYASQAGVLTLSVNTDDVVEIGQVIGSIDSDGEEKAEEPSAKEEKAQESEPETEPEPEPKQKEEDRKSVV